MDLFCRERPIPETVQEDRIGRLTNWKLNIVHLGQGSVLQPRNISHETTA